MQIPKEYLKLKTSLLKELSKLQQQHRLLTIKRVANLPSLNKRPEIRKLMEELIAQDTVNPVKESKFATESFSVTKITQCITPPYTHGYSVYNDHPYNLAPPIEKMPDVWNPFSSVNPFTGEISLSAISGQNFYEFYGGVPFPFINGILGYYYETCGNIVQHIKLPLPYDYDTLVEINLSVDLPPNYSDVVEFIPGHEAGSYDGLLGAEGFIDILVSHPFEESYTTYSTSNNFLNAWSTFGGGEISAYDRNPACKLLFKLPAGVAEFWIHVNAHINAHSDLPNNQLEADPQTYNYALVDFRAITFTTVRTIRNHFYSNWDHSAPGAITIKKICISYEPYYIIPPDTR